MALVNLTFHWPVSELAAAILNIIECVNLCTNYNVKCCHFYNQTLKKRSVHGMYTILVNTCPK